MSVICPKCHYQRRQADADTPEWQCPKCGIVYHKYRVADEDQERLDAQQELLSEVEPGKKRNGFRTLRISVLLLILAFVALDAWLTKVRTTDWDHPLRVVVYPINPENSPTVQHYIDTLTVSDFESVDQFLAREARRYNVALQTPVRVRMGPQIAEMPPLPPVGGSTLQIMQWSLSFRYWAFRVDEYQGPAPEVRVFITYFDPKQHERLEHSTGLEKGMISIVKAFADEALEAQNNVVIAHEMLHTLGATDKYSFSDGLPHFPHGYAEPELEPRWPQQKAEIMGGKIPLSAEAARMPTSLDETLVGAMTAAEIGWLTEINE